MMAARWCHLHGYILEESWEGCSCPAGHDIISTEYRHKKGLRYWIVDMDVPCEDPRFCLWIVTDGVPMEPEWSTNALDPEHGTKAYLEHYEHWAKSRSHSKRDMSFFERARAGRI